MNSRLVGLPRFVTFFNSSGRAAEKGVSTANAHTS